MKISIITPSFNQAEFLKETIESVINQGYHDLEYIIIDGGSSDSSVDIIKSYEDHLTYWVSEKDGGQSEAINKGFSRATGDVVAWLNSDDLYTPDTLKEVVHIFKNENHIDVVNGGTLILGRKQNTLRSMKTGMEFAQRIAGVPSPQPSYFFRRRVFDTIKPLNESLHFGMDYDFFMRLALEYHCESFPDRVWSKYRIHDGSKTANDQLKFADEWARIFSTILANTSSEKQIEHWAKLDLYDPFDFSYNTEKISPRDLDDASGIALFNVASFLNFGADKRKVSQILNLIAKEYPQTRAFFGLRNAHRKMALKNLIQKWKSPFRL